MKLIDALRTSCYTENKINQFISLDGCNRGADFRGIQLRRKGL